MPREDDYRRLVTEAAFVELPGRTLLRIAGRDRAGWFHNFCTAEIQGLRPGQGSEAFVLDARGRIQGHGLVAVDAEAITFDTVPEQAAPVIRHLERYIIREDVHLVDASPETSWLLVTNPHASPFTTDWPTMLYDWASFRAMELRPPSKSADGNASESVSIQKVAICGEANWLVRGNVDAIGVMAAGLAARGIAAASFEAFDAARIEFGFPLYGVDFSSDNFPQEIRRDDRAISFRKGCYLGQETVARIDALGHVNRLLVGVRFFGATVPPVPVELVSGGKPVGAVSSSAWSPALGAPVGLAIVRRSAAEPGTELESPAGRAVVVPLPMPRS